MTETNYSISVSHMYDAEQMWHHVREFSRVTVGKADIESKVSDKFKRGIMVSMHSPIRMLWFIIRLNKIPTYVAQQFSRHAIASASPTDFFSAEHVNKTDVEHFIRTQRSDRTGLARGSQEDPVDYVLTANAQGLVDMSKKRMCMCADPMARKIWLEVRAQVLAIEPSVAMMMAPTCVHSCMCTEVHMKKCDWIGCTAWKRMRGEILNVIAENSGV